MSELYRLLKPVTDELHKLGNDLAEKLPTLLARLNGKLDEEEKRLLAWVTTHLAASDPIVDQPTAQTPDELAEQTTGESDQTSDETGQSPAEQVASPTNEPATDATTVDGAQGATTVGDGGDPNPVDAGQHIS